MHPQRAVDFTGTRRGVQSRAELQDAQVYRRRRERNTEEWSNAAGLKGGRYEEMKRALTVRGGAHDEAGEHERLPSITSRSRHGAELFDQSIGGENSSTLLFATFVTEKGPETRALFVSGAEGGIRTPTVLRPPAPQAGASASSATSASRIDSTWAAAAAAASAASPASSAPVWAPAAPRCR